MKLVITLLLLLTIVGCGSDSSSETAKAGSAAFTARFIDSPVENLAFVNQSGATTYSDSTGSFNCTKGELLSVMIGDLELGRLACGEKVYPHAITDDVDFSATARGTYLSAVLQRIDEDNDPSNGIKISAAAQAVTGYPDPKFFDSSFVPATEFASMNGIVTLAYPDNSRDWVNLADLNGYIASDVVPHLEQSAQDYIADIRSSVIADTFVGTYSEGASSVTNTAGSPCAYTAASASISCATYTCQLTLNLREGGLDTFTYMFTQYPVVAFANTFGDGSVPDPFYRMIVDLKLVNDGAIKITGTYLDDHTVSAPVCGGTFTLVHD